MKLARQTRFPGWRTMSGVQRRNAKMDALFEDARRRQAAQAACTTPVYYECGICGHYHLWSWGGDCRDDANRFTDEQLDALHGGPMNYEIRTMDERVAADMGTDDAQTG